MALKILELHLFLRYNDSEQLYKCELQMNYKKAMTEKARKEVSYDYYL